MRTKTNRIIGMHQSHYTLITLHTHIFPLKIPLIICKSFSAFVFPSVNGQMANMIN